MTTKTEQKPLQIRAQVRPKTIDEEKRCVQIVLSTEKPVIMYDWDRGYIDEILLVSGAQYPKQLPLLNSHNRYETSDVRGSVREIKKENDELVGWAYFADTEKAEDDYKLVKARHLTDISIGYYIEESQIIESGETATVNGKNYTASNNRALRVVTKYNVKEGSLTAIGANDEAKVRSEQNKEAIKKMTEEEKKRAAEEAQKRAEAKAKEEEETRQKLIAEAQEQERQRCADINEICGQHDVDPTEFIRTGANLDVVNRSILNMIAERRNNTQNAGATVEITRENRDKVRNFCENSLALRFGCDIPHEKDEAVRLHTIDLVREYLSSQGVRDIKRMTREQLARRAFSHSGDDFANLLANSLNKRLQKSYDQAPTTYQHWANIVEVPDFKQVSVNRLSEGGDMELIPEGSEYPEETYSDAKEVYTLSKYGKLLTITWEALVNDDLNAFARIAKLQGAAAARKVNAVAYAVLTANANMSDGTALFAAGHSNYGTTSTALSASTLAAKIAAMAIQKGINTNVSLNVSPKFLLVPHALRITARELVESPVKPGSNQGHTKNLLAGEVQVIADALLDANSSTGWFLAADPGQIDTVDVAFLEGHRTPFLDEEDGFIVDGRKYKVRMPVVAKAIDWRGLAYYTGAS